MTARTVVAWIVAAVLGLVVAVAITLAASQLSSQLSSQRVGLSGEPLSAGDQLVPRAQPSTAPRRPSHPSQPATDDEAREAGGDD
jgi:hypothetical protein